MIKTVILSGSELMIDGLDGQNTIVRNLGDETVFASVSPSVEPGADNVAEIPAGGGVNLYGTRGTVYLLGSGKVQLTGTDYSTVNFKKPPSQNSGGGSIMPHMDGIFGYFTPESADILNDMWVNLIEGENNFKFTAGETSMRDNCLHLSDKGMGSLSSVKNPKTIYIIFRTNQIPAYYGTAISMEYAYPASKGYGVHIQETQEKTEKRYAIIDEINGSLIALSGISVDTYQVYATAYDNSETVYMGYANGVWAKDAVIGTSTGGYKGMIYLNRHKFFFYNKWYDNADKLAIDYMMIAIGSVIHTEQQVIENSEWLLKKYLGR